MKREKLTPYQFYYRATLLCGGFPDYEEDKNPCCKSDNYNLAGIDRLEFNHAKNCKQLTRKNLTN